MLTCSHLGYSHIKIKILTHSKCLWQHFNRNTVRFITVVGRAVFVTQVNLPIKLKWICSVITASLSFLALIVIVWGSMVLLSHTDHALFLSQAMPRTSSTSMHTGASFTTHYIFLLEKQRECDSMCKGIVFVYMSVYGSVHTSLSQATSFPQERPSQRGGILMWQLKEWFEEGNKMPKNISFLS